jgi:hypothetical protein
MTPQPRDTFDQREQEREPRWRDLLKAILIGVSAVIVAVDHVWAKYEKFRHIRHAIHDGQIPATSWIVIATIAATIALAVVIVKDWTDLRQHFKLNVVMARNLCTATWRKLIKR